MTLVKLPDTCITKLMHIKYRYVIKIEIPDQFKMDFKQKYLMSFKILPRYYIDKINVCVGNITKTCILVTVSSQY